MRVCPKCGHKDYLEWKNLPYQLYNEYMAWADFQNLYPKIASELELSPKFVNGKDGHGYHRIKKGHIVHRAPIELCINGKFYHGSSTMEKHKIKVPSQLKLSEWNGKQR